MKQLRLIITAIVAVGLVMVVCGCGGGGAGGTGDTGTGTQQPTGTVTIHGRVVAADRPAQALPLAEIIVRPSGITGRADALGQFLISNVPSGTLTIEINPAQNPEYVPAAVIVPTLPNGQVTLVARLLPRAVGDPTNLVIAPRDTSVEIGGAAQFQAEIVTPTGATGLAPTWLEVGSAGTLSEDGLFSAEAVGTSDVYAFSGALSASTSIRVLGLQGPVIAEVVVNPRTLPASGGDSTITVAAADAQGILGLAAEIAYPDGTVDYMNLVYVPGYDLPGNFRTYRCIYPFPPNSNPTDPLGVQEPQVYEVRIIAEDVEARLSASSIIKVTVEGVEAPPPPPAPPGP